jgi:invasion protein IalB
MKIFVVALLGLAIALSTVPATAQDTKPAATDAKPKVGQRIGDWFFQCQALSANENISGLMQNFFDNRTKRQIVGVAVRYAGKGKDQRLGMFVTVPLGIFLGSGIGGKIDGEKQFKFNLQSCKTAKLQSCSQRRCQAGIEIKGKQLAALKKANG